MTSQSHETLFRTKKTGMDPLLLSHLWKAHQALQSTGRQVRMGKNSYILPLISYPPTQQPALPQGSHWIPMDLNGSQWIPMSSNGSRGTDVKKIPPPFTKLETVVPPFLVSRMETRKSPPRPLRIFWGRGGHCCLRETHVFAPAEGRSGGRKRGSK